MPYTGSQAIAGRGTTISIGATPTLIGEVDDFPLTRGKWETVDTTNLESGSDSEFLPTVRKPGTLTFKGNRVSTDAGQILVEAAYQGATIQEFTIQLPKSGTQTTTGDKITFNAYVLGSDFTVQPTQKIAFSIELQISGPTTVTAGT